MIMASPQVNKAVIVKTTQRIGHSDAKPIGANHTIRYIQYLEGKTVLVVDVFFLDQCYYLLIR